MGELVKAATPLDGSGGGGASSSMEGICTRLKGLLLTGSSVSSRSRPRDCRRLYPDPESGGSLWTLSGRGRFSPLVLRGVKPGPWGMRDGKAGMAGAVCLNGDLLTRLFFRKWAYELLVRRATIGPLPLPDEDACSPSRLAIRSGVVGGELGKVRGCELIGADDEDDVELGATDNDGAGLAIVCRREGSRVEIRNQTGARLIQP